MNFKQRFTRFGVGIGIGLLLSVVIFSKREWFGWTPNAMVLKRLTATYLPTEKGDCLLDCHNINQEDVQTVITEGEVDFGNSKTHQEPVVYQVSIEQLKSVEFIFEAQGDTATLVGLEDLSRKMNCNCD